MKDKIEHRDPRLLRHNIDNPRGEIPETPELLELAASIREKGILQPPSITPDNVIIIGHRRVAASILAELKRIPVIIVDSKPSRIEQIEMMLIENAQRQGLTTLQTARAYEAVCDRGVSLTTLAKALGMNKGTVANYLDILKLPSELHAYFEEEKLPLGAVQPLMRLKPTDQRRLGKRAAEDSDRSTSYKARAGSGKGRMKGIECKPKNR